MGNASSAAQKLTKNEREFLIQNTQFSKKEIQMWHQSFLKECPTGFLSKTQFKHICADILPEGSVNQCSDYIFKAIDRDNSDSIDFKEFLVAIHITANGTPEEKLAWTFSVYDLDGNGTIERDELVNIFSSILHVAGTENATDSQEAEARAAKIFNTLDQNNDSVITKQEFIQGCMADVDLCAMLAINPADT